MDIVFSFLLQGLLQRNIQFTKANCTDLTPYQEFLNLVPDHSLEFSMDHQKMYLPNHIYVGKFSSFNPAKLTDSSAFIFAGPQAESIPEGVEYAFIQEKDIPSVKQILSEFFYSPPLWSGSRELYLYLIQNRGIKFLVDIFSEILGNPVILSEPYHFDWVVCSSSYESKANDIVSIINYRELPTSYGDVVIEYGLEKQLMESNRPILFDKGSYSSEPRIVQGIVIQDKLVAAVTVIQSNRPFEHKDFDVIQFLTAILTEEILKKGTPESAVYEFQLKKLLKGEPSEINTLTAWSRNAQTGVPDPMRLIVIFSEEATCFELESISRKKFNPDKNVKITRLKENIVLLVKSPSEEAERRFMDEFQVFLETVQQHAVVSPVVRDFDLFSMNYKLTCEAHSIGRILQPEQALYYFEELSTFCLLQAADQNTSLEFFIAPQIHQLKRYDSVRHTDYYKTVESYLLLNDKNAVISELNIHKNTLNYRLEKIREIIQADLDDPAIRQALVLSCQIERFLRVKRELNGQ